MKKCQECSARKISCSFCESQLLCVVAGAELGRVVDVENAVASTSAKRPARAASKTPSKKAKVEKAKVESKVDAKYIGASKIRKSDIFDVELMEYSDEQEEREGKGKGVPWVSADNVLER